MKTQHYRFIASVGYFSLLLLIPLWHLWLSPPALSVNPCLIASIWIIPLLLPLRGIIKGEAYTFAYSAFIALLYITHALVVSYSAYVEWIYTELTLAIIELIFASLFLFGSIYFAKHRGQELGLSIRDTKK